MNYDFCHLKLENPMNKIPKRNTMKKAFVGNSSKIYILIFKTIQARRADKPK